MRQLQKNKRQLYYANYSGTIDITDGFTELDGEMVPVKVGTTQGYTAPVPFKANLSFDSGETQQSEYGLSVGDYDAVISANKGELPLSERSLIWHKSRPETDERGLAVPESADYRVIAIKTSINEERFILKAREKDNA